MYIQDTRVFSSLIYRSSTFPCSPNGAAQHACYDDLGNLIVNGEERGTPDKVAIEPRDLSSSTNQTGLPTFVGQFSHEPDNKTLGS